MTAINRMIAAFCAVFIMNGAVHARSFVSIPSLDEDSAMLADEDKRPPKCIFVWGGGLPSFDAKGTGRVTIVTEDNRYSRTMKRLAGGDGAIPLLIASDEHNGERITVELKNVRVEKFQIISAGPEAKPRRGETDVLHQEWSLVYETIQRVQ